MSPQMHSVPGPGYWKNETSGVLQCVIEKYLDCEPLTIWELAMMRWYVCQWIDSPVWNCNPFALHKGHATLADLRRMAHLISSQQQMAQWLARATEFGVDPL